MLSGLMALGLLASLGSSTLSRPHQAAFSAPSSIDDLARRFAPVIYLAEDEPFRPSSLRAILPAFMAVDEAGVLVPSQPAPLSPSNLDSLPFASRLAIDSLQEGNYNAQPDLKGVDQRIFGEDRSKEGDWDVLCVVVEKSAEGVVDLFYWTYYPYNLGKNVKPLGWIGNHVSDWEGMMVRTRHGEGVSVDYLAHQGDLGYGTVAWKDVPKEDGRPVAFSAYGSHGLWPTPGEHPYARALNLFSLIDDCSSGSRWNVSLSLSVLPFFSPLPPGASRSHRREKASHYDKGALSWVGFRGAWGDEGDESCWWFGLTKTCQTVGGPAGPWRDSMMDQPQCLLCDVIASPSVLPRSSSSSSSLRPALPPSRYSFAISPSLLETIPLDARQQVAVRQLCRWDGLDELPDIDPHADDRKGRKRRGEEILWAWASEGQIEEDSDGVWKVDMDVRPCRKDFSIHSYSIALAPTPSPFDPSSRRPSTDPLPSSRPDCHSCSYLPSFRKVCSRDRPFGATVQVRDVDLWGWT